MDTNPTSAPGESLRDKIMNKILRINDDDDHHEQDICRVCRLAGDDTLYHPCLCTGSIKYVHQDCLMQWLKYSKKEVCELCNHKFSFRPVYREDMPERLPAQEFLKGVLVIAARFMRHFFVCCLVASCWLGFVPLMAIRIHRLVSSGITSFFSLKVLSLFSLENVAADIGTGMVIVAIFTCTLFSLIWLKDQIMVGAPPAFLHLPPERGDNQRDNAVHVELRDEMNARPDIRPDDEANAVAAGQPAADNGDGDNNDAAESAVNAAADQLPIGGADAADGTAAQPLVVEAVAPPAAQALIPAAPPPADNNIFGEENDDADHFADEFTWQRILGLDGSTAFIDAIFYVIAMNLLFDALFVHWPAEIGKILFQLLGYSDKVVYFSVPIQIFTGYVIVFIANYFVHQAAGYFRYRQLYTLSAMFHLMVKVFLLFIVEILFFPVICGWWLDVCSLPLTGVTLDARLTTFRGYPFSSTFLHWMVGMIYVFYSASFILVLRELLRPGVLWFIRNLNDPDFNPILEMIQQSVVRHARRLVASTMLFFTIILLVVYAPLRLISFVSPSTLPYVLTASAETSMGEVSVELVLLQLVLPTVLEYSKAFSILKKLVQLWCGVVGGWLKLDGYLLPRQQAARGNVDPDAAERRQDNARRLMVEAGQLIQQINRFQPRPADEMANANVAEPQRIAAGLEVNGDQPAAESPKNDDAIGFVGMVTVEDEDIGTEEEEDELSRSHADKPVNAHTETVIPSTSRSAESANNIKDTTNEDDQQPSTSAGLHNDFPPETQLPHGLSSSVHEQRDVVEADVVEPPINDAAAAGDQLPRPDADDDPLEDPVILAQQLAQRERQENHLGARHQALLMIRDNVDYEEYERPDMFAARIVALLACLALTAITISFLFFLVPVSIGRFIFAVVAKFDAAKGGETTPTHELYTLAAGLYFCWVVSKAWIIVYEWCQKGWNYVSKVFRSTAWLIVRLLVAMVPMFIVIPFMLGLLFQLLVVAPLRVTMSQTPLFFPWKEWAIGVLHFKIFCASILMGPDWWLKTAFERVYAGGIRGFELHYLLTNLALPLFNFISLQISLPYVLAKVILFFFDLPDETKVMYTRFAYPFTLFCVTAIAFFLWQWQKLKSLAQKIRNDKYLIGTQLVNFYRESGAALDASATTAAGGGAAP